MLDAILTRVQRVTGCSSAGIVLRDHDAPWRGRVYLAAKSCRDLPVSRVALDDDMMVTLAAEPEALTVARCEDARHSFLVPLKELGAEFFWVWPVKIEAHVEAILAVGYQEPPVADPHIGRCGSEFAARLAIALTKAARDEQLYRQAHFDPLTGLPNRVLFCSRLSAQLQSAASGMENGAVLYIDLDHFKKINDTVGHAAGDQVLSVAAQRLRSCVKDIDTVARLGGDEFAVILRDVVSAEAAEAVAQRIVQSLQQPVNLAGKDHTVCASIGIALFPQDGEAIDTLLRNADTAMYRAKDLGRGRAMFYDINMGGQRPVPTETGLQLALRRREFSLFYQPQYSIADGSLTGLEALLRWQTQREGMRQPGDFVPAAEESGLIVDIGGWVLETACAQLAAWREQGLSPPRLALNVSLQQLRHPEFVRSIRRMLDRFSLPGDILELDIDEKRARRSGQCRAGRTPGADRRVPGAGRLRHRLFLARLSAPASDQRGEDRPQLPRQRAAGSDRGNADRDGDRDGALAEQARGRRRHRNHRAAGFPARAALRLRAGLLPRPAAARGVGDRTAELAHLR